MFRGREARPASTAWNLAKTAGQTVVFWALFLGLVPLGITATEGRLGQWWPRLTPMPALGLAIFTAFGTLGLVSGATMAIAGRGTPMPQDCPRRLVIVGPYRFVRNPMAIAGLAQGAGVGLGVGSVGVLLYVGMGFLAWNFVVRRWEEADLEARFGEDFRRYRASVRCWIPRLRPYTHVARPTGDVAALSPKERL